MNYEDKKRVKDERDRVARTAIGLKPRKDLPKRYDRAVYREKQATTWAEQGLREVEGRLICNHCGKSSGKFRPAKYRHEEGCIHELHG